MWFLAGNTWARGQITSEATVKSGWQSLGGLRVQVSKIYDVVRARGRLLEEQNIKIHPRTQAGSSRINHDRAVLVGCSTTTAMGLPTCRPNSRRVRLPTSIDVSIGQTPEGRNRVVLFIFAIEGGSVHDRRVL